MTTQHKTQLLKDQNELRPNRRWGADRVQEKTSLHFLLTLILAKDNYSRWKSDRTVHKKLSEEVNALLRENGITHRKSGSIRNRIWALERSVMLARDLESGFPVWVSLDGCSPELKAKIVGRCPHFELLVPVMASPILQNQHVRTNAATAVRNTDASAQLRAAVPFRKWFLK